MVNGLKWIRIRKWIKFCFNFAIGLWGEPRAFQIKTPSCLKLNLIHYRITALKSNQIKYSIKPAPLLPTPTAMPVVPFHAINPAARIPYNLWSGVYFLKHVELVKLVTNEKNPKDAMTRWAELTQDQRDQVLRHSLGYRYPCNAFSACRLPCPTP